MAKLSQVLDIKGKTVRDTMLASQAFIIHGKRMRLKLCMAKTQGGE